MGQTVESIKEDIVLRLNTMLGEGFNHPLLVEHIDALIRARIDEALGDFSGPRQEVEAE